MVYVGIFQLVQSCVRQGFSETMRKPRNSKQWFQDTLVNDDSDDEVNNVVQISRNHNVVNGDFLHTSIVNEDENKPFDIGEQVSKK